MYIFHRVIKNTPHYVRHKGKYIHNACGDLDPEELFSKCTILKDSGTVSAGIYEKFFLKRYNKKKFWKRLKRALQYPRANRCLAGSILLRQNGFLTPETYYADRQYLVTETLEKFSPDLFLSAHPEMIHEFAATLRQLHDKGFFHGDLSLRNIYKSGKNSFGLIDLDSILFYPSRSGVPQKKRIKEIARVISSAKLLSGMDDLDLLTDSFLAQYDPAQSTPIDRKKLMKEILLYIRKTNRH